MIHHIPQPATRPRRADYTTCCVERRKGTRFKLPAIGAGRAALSEWAKGTAGTATIQEDVSGRWAVVNIPVWDSTGVLLSGKTAGWQTSALDPILCRNLGEILAAYVSRQPFDAA